MPPAAKLQKEEREREKKKTLNVIGGQQSIDTIAAA